MPAPSPCTPGTGLPPPATTRLSVAEALEPFEERLRQQLPTAEDILRRAASRRQVRRRSLGGTAVALAVAALLWWDPAYRTEEIATAIGERSSWQAPDGSTVALNTHSRVRVAWHLRSRRLELLQGEASFQVAHAPWHGWAPWAERRFTVATVDLTVQDIGTVFNVRTHPAAGTEVTVLQGRVRVLRPGAPEQELAAGQALHGGAQGLEPPRQVDAERQTAWREGRLVLDQTPLDQALAEIQRHRAAPLVLADPALGRLRLSGQFDLARTEQLIALLPTLLPVRIVRDANGRVTVHAAR